MTDLHLSTSPGPGEADAQTRHLDDTREQRAFQSYFAQITSVTLALQELRSAFAASLWAAEFYARSLNCAWATLEARRTQLEMMPRGRSLSRPGMCYLRNRMQQVFREGWAKAACYPDGSEVLVRQLRQLEDRLAPVAPSS